MIAKILGPFFESKPTDQAGANTLLDGRELVKTVSLLLLILPFFLGILLLNRLLDADYIITSILSGIILLTFFIRKLLNPSTINIITSALSIFFILTVTAICTIRNGIYDVSIVAFPVIVGFSSIILRQRELIITSAFTFFSVSWLILGDLFQWYPRDRMISSTIGDFVVAATFVSMAGILTYVLTSNIRKSISYAHQEAERKKSAANALEKELCEKNRLIEEIHQKVTRSLGFIGKLTKQNEPHSTRNGQLKSVQRKIMGICSAHEILLQTQNYESVEIQSYLPQLLTKYGSLYLIEAPQWTFSCETLSLPLDRCISFGLCFLEMVHRAIAQTDSKIGIAISSGDHVTLKIESKRVEYKQSSSELLEIMVRQLKGKIEITAEGEHIIQELIFEAGIV